MSSSNGILLAPTAGAAENPLVAARRSLAAALAALVPVGTVAALAAVVAGPAFAESEARTLSTSPYLGFQDSARPLG